MNKINIENFNDLKSWPFKEAQQILKRNGGLANFKIPEKVIIFVGQSINAMSAFLTIVVLTTSQKVPICGNPEGP